MSSELAPSGVREGDIIAGKYRIERVLGTGGMGVVVAAHHIQLDERVALKFLLPDALRNADIVARFAREARAAVKIKSEHVARVIDVGQLGNGAPFMVMEYLEGGDLESWLAERGPLPIQQAVEFVLHACVALADAHALGIVHRDLKPANLFCVRRSDGQLSVKVLDFGISKMADPRGEASALTGASVIGTPIYMSPEQIRSAKDVTAQTDIWALGAILFELLTGKAVFASDSMMGIAVKVTNDPAPRVGTLRRDVPTALEDAIAKCLEKAPAHRYADVGELSVALLPFAPRRARESVERIAGIISSAGTPSSVGLEVRPAAETSAPTVPAVTMGSVHGGATAIRKRRAVLLGFAAAAGALLIVVVGLTRRHDPSVGVNSAVASGAANAGASAGAAEDPPPKPELREAPVGASATSRPLPPAEPPKGDHAAVVKPPPTRAATTPSAKPLPKPAAPRKPNPLDLDFEK